MSRFLARVSRLWILIACIATTPVSLALMLNSYHTLSTSQSSFAFIKPLNGQHLLSTLTYLTLSTTVPDQATPIPKGSPRGTPGTTRPQGTGSQPPPKSGGGAESGPTTISPLVWLIIIGGIVVIGTIVFVILRWIWRA